MFSATLLILLFRQRYIDPVRSAGDPARKPSTESAETSEGRTLLGPLGCVLGMAAIFTLYNYQLAGSMVVFAATLIDLEVLGFHVPPSWILALNPLLLVFFIAFADPMKGGGLLRSAKTTATRFATGMAITAVAFLIMAMAAHLALPDRPASLWWVIAACAILTLGEVLLGPALFSAVSRLSSRQVQSISMGALSAAFGLGAWLSGRVGAATVEFDHVVVFAGLGLGAFALAGMLYAGRGWLTRSGA